MPPARSIRRKPSNALNSTGPKTPAGKAGKAQGDKQAARVTPPVNGVPSWFVVQRSGSVPVDTLRWADSIAPGDAVDSILATFNRAKLLAELSGAEKNALSHRARAVHALAAQLAQALPALRAGGDAGAMSR